MGSVRFLLTKHLLCQISGQTPTAHKAPTFISCSHLLLYLMIIFMMESCDTSSLFVIKKPFILILIIIRDETHSRVNLL